MTALPVAYGLALPGLEHDGSLLESTESWPPLHANYDVDRPGAPRLENSGAAGDDRLERSSPLGRVILDRIARTARYFTRTQIDVGEFVHPYLTTAATAFARWDGHQVFHAGALIAGGRAWAVVGDNGAGKSTLLGSLALAGHPILADDLLVLGDGDAFAGPRCLDLREGSIGALGAADAVRASRRGERSRLTLGVVPARVPFGGWVFLAWGERTEIQPLTVAERLSRVAYERMWWDLPTDPVTVLALARQPCIELRRPRRWSEIESATALLLERLGEITCDASVG